MRYAFSALVAAVLVTAVGPGWAACHQRPIGETLPAFRSALGDRLTPLADHLAYLGGEPETGAIYEAQPSKAGVRLVTDDAAILSEIGTDVTAPYRDADLDALMTIAAFTVARLSSEPEPKVKDALYGDLRQHAGLGDWSRKWGGTVAVSTKSDRGLVVRIFKADCD